MISQGIVITIFLEAKIRFLRCLDIKKKVINQLDEQIKVIRNDKGGVKEVTFSEFCS